MSLCLKNYFLSKIFFFSFRQKDISKHILFFTKVSLLLCKISTLKTYKKCNLKTCLFFAKMKLSFSEAYVMKNKFCFYVILS